MISHAKLPVLWLQLYYSLYVHIRNAPQFLDSWVSANGAQPDQTALQNKSAQCVHYLQFYLHLLEAVP